jgi:hypothetical protein
VGLDVLFEGLSKYTVGVLRELILFGAPLGLLIPKFAVHTRL